MQIEIYGQYYYRGENHVPRRITIVAPGPNAGFYWCVDGHFTKEEIEDKAMQPFLIHKNKIVQ